MAEEYCESSKKMCDPKDCNVEFCRWRDTKWIRSQLASWAYNTNGKKGETISQKNQAGDEQTKSSL